MDALCDTLLAVWTALARGLVPSGLLQDFAAQTSAVAALRDLHEFNFRDRVWFPAAARALVGGRGVALYRGVISGCFIEEVVVSGADGAAALGVGSAAGAGFAWRV